MSQDDRAGQAAGEVAKARQDARSAAAGACGKKLVVVPSACSVEEAAERIKAELHARGVPLFAVFDHAKNAREAGLELRPTQVLVFGAPKIGTLLMQKDQSLAYELPLRMALWEDEEGRRWLGYARAEDALRPYGFEGHPAVEKMDALLGALARAAGRRP